MKKKFSKKVVITSYVLVGIFTIVCLVYQFVARESIDQTLIGFFYSFFGVELLTLGGIKGVRLFKSNSVGTGEE